MGVSFPSVLASSEPYFNDNSRVVAFCEGRDFLSSLCACVAAWLIVRSPSLQIVLTKDLEGLKVTLPKVTRNFYVGMHARLGVFLLGLRSL